MRCTFSTATIVMRTRKTVKLQVHCLSSCFAVAYPASCLPFGGAYCISRYRDLLPPWRRGQCFSPKHQ